MVIDASLNPILLKDGLELIAGSSSMVMDAGRGLEKA